MSYLLTGIGISLLGVLLLIISYLLPTTYSVKQTKVKKMLSMDDLTRILEKRIAYLETI